MLTHPTLDQLRALKLDGMADAFGAGCCLFAHPTCDGLGHGAAKNGRGRDRDPASVKQDDGFEPHHVRRLARTRSSDRRQ